MKYRGLFIIIGLLFLICLLFSSCFPNNNVRATKIQFAYPKSFYFEPARGKEIKTVGVTTVTLEIILTITLPMSILW